MFWLDPILLILILFGAMVMFGTAYLPEIGRWLRRSLDELKDVSGARTGGENSGHKNA